jgi:hypothetical protein
MKADKAACNWTRHRMKKIPQIVSDWLLEKNDPSIRYRYLTEYLGEKESNPDVREAKKEIKESKPVVRIFKKMHPDGYWLHRGKGAGIEYASSASTHYVLSYLAELGMRKDDKRIEKAVERYLSLVSPDTPDPAPWQIPPDYRNHQSCLYAMNLRTFQILGYGNDKKIAVRKSILLEDNRFDGGYLCDRPSFTETTKSCIRGSIKALMAYSQYPDLWNHQRCKDLVAYFLKRRVAYKMANPTELIRGEMFSLMFPFIHNGNLIEPLYALSKMGYGKRPELTDCWEQLERKMLHDGRMPIDRAPVTIFKSGEKGKPNKWITFYAYMALKFREENSRIKGERRKAEEPRS